MPARERLSHQKSASADLAAVKSNLWPRGRGRPNAKVTANLSFSGGGGGIRTHERLTPLPVFKTGAFNRSATPPVPYFTDFSLRLALQLRCVCLQKLVPLRFHSEVVPSGASPAPAARARAASTTRSSWRWMYRRNIMSVLCPNRVFATASDMSEVGSIRVAAVQRKPCISLRDNPLLR